MAHNLTETQAKFLSELNRKRGILCSVKSRPKVLITGELSTAMPETVLICIGFGYVYCDVGSILTLSPKGQTAADLFEESGELYRERDDAF